MNREEFAQLLWELAPKAPARNSLRPALKELREVLDADADMIEIDRFTVGPRGAEFAVDVLRFRDLIATAKADPATLLAASALWQGELFGSAQLSAPMSGPKSRPH